MGVFARLFRRSKTTEEASTTEARAGRPPAGSEADGTAEAKESGETSAGAGTEPAPAKESERGDASEAVEIPQQQSPGTAADSEADESART
ncbi:hypothetical protein [Streptomyces chromofuscus]|uniref:Gliding motility protein n=1 Tax=Streptomyces chromofuscus TaxID=42881 RepID=A0A7M2T431_STRCW|nr:hypothetical protein [Streptomyces chromofuscus]QOV43437.1 hypothetical protein IPT68_27455 [Streptomyces chromofuscus]GGT09508.1 hypothetical protein GCM10010254_32470 [Streptomyces chromofuscus]